MSEFEWVLYSDDTAEEVEYWLEKHHIDYEWDSRRHLKVQHVWPEHALPVEHGMVLVADPAKNGVWTYTTEAFLRMKLSTSGMTTNAWGDGNG